MSIVPIPTTSIPMLPSSKVVNLLDQDSPLVVGGSLSPSTSTAAAAETGVSDDPESTTRRDSTQSHGSSSGGEEEEEETHIPHHLPKLNANHHKKINGWLRSVREKMGETRQGKNPLPPSSSRNLLVSPPFQTRSKMFFRSLSVGNMMMYNSMDMDDADQPLLPPPSPMGMKDTKSSISHLSSTEVESKSSDEATSKDNDREVLDEDDDEEDEGGNNSKEMEDGNGAAKPMSVRRQLVAANPPRDFTRPHLGKSYGRSLSLRDVTTTTTTTSFDTMMSPQCRRRGRKPGTKHVPSSPSTPPSLRSPPTRRDHHRNPKQQKDARHRSKSSHQESSKDRSRPRSQSTSKPRRESSSTRSIPYEIEVMESSGQDDRTAALARSRSRPRRGSTTSDSSSSKHRKGTDAPPSDHRSPLPSLPGCSRRGSAERGSGRLDSPSSSHHHYLKSPSSISRLPKSSPTTTTRPQSLRSTSIQRVRTAGVFSPQHRSQSMRSLYMDANERPPRTDPLLKTPSRVERKPSLPAVLTQLYSPSSTSSLDEDGAIDEVLPTRRRSRRSSLRRCRPQSKPGNEVM